MNNLYRLVQPTSAAFDVGRQNTGRSLLSAATGESKSAFRASCSLASACPLFLASGAGQGTARGADRAGGELPAQPQAFAHRRHPTRGVSGISGEPLTEQHAVSLRRSSQRLPSRLHPERGATTSRAPIHRIGMRSLLPGIANHPEFDHRISPDQRTGGELPAQPQAFAHRRHPARGVSGISGESLTEQHAVSLRRSSQRLPSALHPECGAITSPASIHRIGVQSLLPGIANHPEFDHRISPDQRTCLQFLDLDLLAAIHDVDLIAARDRLETPADTAGGLHHRPFPASGVTTPLGVVMTSFPSRVTTP